MNPLPKRYQLLTPLAVIVCNLLLAYAVYFLARIIYLTINYSYFYQDLTLVHLFELLGAGLVFDDQDAPAAVDGTKLHLRF